MSHWNFFKTNKFDTSSVMDYIRKLEKTLPGNTTVHAEFLEAYEKASTDLREFRDLKENDSLPPNLQTRTVTFTLPKSTWDLIDKHVSKINLDGAFLESSKGFLPKEMNDVINKSIESNNSFIANLNKVSKETGISFRDALIGEFASSELMSLTQTMCQKYIESYSAYAMHTGNKEMFVELAAFSAKMNNKPFSDKDLNDFRKVADTLFSVRENLKTIPKDISDEDLNSVIDEIISKARGEADADSDTDENGPDIFSGDSDDDDPVIN